MPEARLLNRQRVLLELADLSGGSLSLRRLTLLAFLVAHESRGRGGGSFYGFVPHREGPTSFTLNHEVKKLAENELLRFGSDQNITRHPSWVGTQEENDFVIDARKIVCRLFATSTDALASRINTRYPTYRREARSDIEEHSQLLYTKGYESLSVEHFLQDLISSGVRNLVDVRSTPVSRRFGFHKRTLEKLAQEMNISYYHFPEVGIPSSERRNLQTREDYRALLAKYENGILRKEGAAIDQIASLARKSASVLMCSERDPSCCHRAILATAISRQNGLQVVHL